MRYLTTVGLDAERFLATSDPCSHEVGLAIMAMTALRATMSLIPFT
jgi:hypothetical protein